MEQPKAKVFVSCGQREGAERQAAQAVGEVLYDLGFDYYIAAAESSLTGLKENVYRQLEESEYILFVDFRREQLANLDTLRGSLFSHQELAVAAYLGIDWIPFQQEGVERNGIMSFTQSNVVPFADPSDLPRLVRREIQRCGWKANWKNALSVEREHDELIDAREQGRQHDSLLSLESAKSESPKDGSQLRVLCLPHDVPAGPVDPAHQDGRTQVGGLLPTDRGHSGRVKARLGLWFRVPRKARESLLQQLYDFDRVHGAPARSR